MAVVVFGILAIAGRPSGAEGQMLVHERTAPRGWLGINVIGADPVGEFGLNVDDGFGLQLEGRIPLDRAGFASLRIDGGGLIYGHESADLCFPPPIGCRIGAELNTTNSIVYGGIGPELAIPGAVSPYVFATMGLSWFATTSSLSGLDDWDDEEYFSTRHLSDVVTAGRLGGGVRIQVGGTSGGPVMLDLGMEYHRNGVAEYLRKGDILDHPDGSITIFPNRTEANMYLVRVGVSFGLGARSNDHGDDRRDRRDKRGRRGR